MARAALGAGLMALGGLFSLLTFLHDVRRIGLPPQGAPKRVPPEIHVLSALLSGAGAKVLWTWVPASLVFVGHVLGAYAVGMPLIDRFAPSGRQENF